MNYFAIPKLIDEIFGIKFNVLLKDNIECVSNRTIDNAYHDNKLSDKTLAKWVAELKAKNKSVDFGEAPILSGNEQYHFAEVLGYNLIAISHGLRQTWGDYYCVRTLEETGQAFCRTAVYLERHDDANFNADPFWNQLQISDGKYFNDMHYTLLMYLYSAFEQTCIDLFKTNEFSDLQITVSDLKPKIIKGKYRKPAWILFNKIAEVNDCSSIDDMAGDKEDIKYDTQQSLLKAWVHGTKQIAAERFHQELKRYYKETHIQPLQSDVLYYSLRLFSYISNDLMERGLPQESINLFFSQYDKFTEIHKEQMKRAGY
ncbi:MAG: hypothetical protein C0603_10605 [Denitrovibrio sp.]|nr:MAG: hypothetical protein C0603_10605 [Denitrovibrio sp.]